LFLSLNHSSHQLATNGEKLVILIKWLGIGIIGTRWGMLHSAGAGARPFTGFFSYFFPLHFLSRFNKFNISFFQ
jgi:hypothetical protein